MTKLQVTVEKVNDILVTTSNRVVEELGVTHRDILEKIDSYINKFGSAELSAGFYIPSKYTHPQNKQEYRNYLITEKGVAQLVGGYSSAVPKAFDLNVAYINKFEEMRNFIKGQFKIPTSFANALRLAAEQQEIIEALALDNTVKGQQILELQPKASYYDLVLQCKGLLSATLIAKDYGKSAQEFNKILHELGIQFKQSGIWLLYQKYADKGYTQTKTQPINRSAGPDVVPHMYWTQKGRLFLYDLLKSNGLMPTIEREA